MKRIAQLFLALTIGLIVNGCVFFRGDDFCKYTKIEISFSTSADDGYAHGEVAKFLHSLGHEITSNHKDFYGELSSSFSKDDSKAYHYFTISQFPGNTVAKIAICGGLEARIIEEKARETFGPNVTAR